MQPHPVSYSSICRSVELHALVSQIAGQLHTGCLRIEAWMATAAAEQAAAALLAQEPPAFQPNPSAPPGNNLKRLKGPMEKGRDRSRAPLRPPVNAGSQPSDVTLWPKQPARAPQQPILAAAVEGQTAHEQCRARAAVQRAATKEQETAAKVAALLLPSDAPPHTVMHLPLSVEQNEPGIAYARC